MRIGRNARHNEDLEGRVVLTRPRGLSIVFSCPASVVQPGRIGQHPLTLSIAFSSSQASYKTNKADMY